MERDKLEIKDEYTGEEALEIARESLFQVSRELDDKLYDIKDRMDKENDSLLKAGMARKKHQIKDDRHTLDKYFSETGDKWLTECCDAPLRYYALNTRGQCSECGEDMPDTYREELTIQDFIKFLNKKIDKENQK